MSKIYCPECQGAHRPTMSAAARVALIEATKRTLDALSRAQRVAMCQRIRAGRKVSIATDGSYCWENARLAAGVVQQQVTMSYNIVGPWRPAPMGGRAAKAIGRAIRRGY